MRIWPVLFCVPLLGAGFCDLTTNWHEDEVACGHLVKWHDYPTPDADALCRELALNEASLGFAFDRGSRIEFVADSNEPCQIWRYEIAGCYDANYDIIYLDYRYPIPDSALAHEELHRYFTLRGSYIYEQGHSDPLWTLIR